MVLEYAMIWEKAIAVDVAVAVLLLWRVLNCSDSAQSLQRNPHDSYIFDRPPVCR